MLKVFSLFGFLALFTLSCSKHSEKVSVLRTALNSEITSLDPSIAYDQTSLMVLGQIYESFYEYDYLNRPFKLIPLLASEMPQVSEDGLVYTIKLKKNIPYHEHHSLKENRFVTASDFVNAFKRLSYDATRSNGWWMVEGKVKGAKKFRETCHKKEFTCIFQNEIEGVKAIHDHELQITLNKRSPEFIYLLSLAFTSPIPEEIIRETKNDLSNMTIGTGPYALKSWNKNLDIKLIKNKKYISSTYPKTGDDLSKKLNLLKDAGAKLPFIDVIDFKIIKETQARWLNFLAKKLDFLILSKDQLSVALDQDGKIKEEFNNFKFQVTPTLTYWWLSFNMNDKILGQNKNLRMAIAHAIDINKLISVYTNNLAERAYSIYPPGVFGHTKENKTKFKYDLKKASEYLKKAGYPNGRGLPAFSYDVRGNGTLDRQMGEFIRAELKMIGIEVKVITNPFPRFLQKVDQGQVQIWQDGWILDYPDAENILQLLISKNKAPGPNSTNYSNKKVDELYETLSTNSKNKNKILEEIESLVQEDLPWMMEYYQRNFVLSLPHLKNFRQSDLIYSSFKYLSIEDN